jgi:hypothetical protein
MRLVTDDTIKAVYECLIQVPPFNGWKLPASSKVKFEVVHDPNLYGEYEPEPHTIRISDAKNGHLDTVIRTVAHEIIHLKLFVDDKATWDKHGRSFLSLSKKVATTLGFDPKEL